MDKELIYITVENYASKLTALSDQIWESAEATAHDCPIGKEVTI